MSNVQSKSNIYSNKLFRKSCSDFDTVKNVKQDNTVSTTPLMKKHTLCCLKGGKVLKLL